MQTRIRYRNIGLGCLPTLWKRSKERIMNDQQKAFLVVFVPAMAAVIIFMLYLGGTL